MWRVDRAQVIGKEPQPNCSATLESKHCTKKPNKLSFGACWPKYPNCAVFLLIITRAVAQRHAAKDKLRAVVGLHETAGQPLFSLIALSITKLNCNVLVAGVPRR